jgi:ABC-type hemin transport system substrate-binding protein
VRIAFITLFLFALAAVGCQRAAHPATESATPRIAALSPALAVMLRDLGLEEHIVARHAWDLALDRRLPVAGDQAGIDYEALIRAQPTHVLLEWGARPLPARLEDLAQRHGWSVHNYRTLTLADIEMAARDLHERFAASAPGAQVWEQTRLASRMNEAFSKRPELAGAGRILLLASLRPPGALGPGSAHDQVLQAIGGQPALQHDGPFMTLDAEDVLRLAPDGIILIMPRPAHDPQGLPSDPGAIVRPGDLRQRLGRIGTLDIPAVRNGRLALIDHPLGQLPTTSLVEVADEMTEILRMWAEQTASGS